MKVFNSLLALAYLSAGFIAEAAPQSNNGKVDSNTTSPKTFEAMKARYNDLMKKELNKRGSYSRCNAKNVRVRKEW
jgi:hypothetical protein